MGGYWRRIVIFFLREGKDRHISLVFFFFLREGKEGYFFDSFLREKDIFHPVFSLFLPETGLIGNNICVAFSL